MPQFSPEPFEPLPLGPSAEGDTYSRPAPLAPLDGLVARPTAGEESPPAPVSPPSVSRYMTNSIRIRFIEGSQAETAEPAQSDDPAEGPADDFPAEVPAAAASEVPLPPPAEQAGSGGEPPREDPPVPTPSPAEGPERTGPPTAETLGRWHNTVQRLTTEVRARVPGEPYNLTKYTSVDETGQQLTITCTTPNSGDASYPEITARYTRPGDNTTLSSLQEHDLDKYDQLARDIAAASQNLPPDQAAWLKRAGEVFSERNPDLQEVATARLMAESPFEVEQHQVYQAAVIGTQTGMTVRWSETIPPSDEPQSEPKTTVMGIWVSTRNGHDYMCTEREGAIDLQAFGSDAPVDRDDLIPSFEDSQRLGITKASDRELGALEEKLRSALGQPHFIQSIAELNDEQREGAPGEAALEAWDNTMAELQAAATGLDTISTNLVVADTQSSDLNIEVRASVSRVIGASAGAFAMPQVTITLSTPGESHTYDSQLPIDEQSRSVVAEDIERIAQNLPADQAEWLRNVHKHFSRSDASRHQTPLRDLVLNSPFAVSQRLHYRASGTSLYDGTRLRAEWEDYRMNYHDPESEPMRDFARVRLITPAGHRTLYAERGSQRHFLSTPYNPEHTNPLDFTPDADEVLNFTQARELGVTQISNRELIDLSLRVQEAIRNPTRPSE